MNNYEKHERLKNGFKIAFQNAFPNARIFDRHVGLFYRKNGNPIKINKKGMADMWAIMPGPYGLIHLEFEIKSGDGQLTREQKAWQKQIRAMGGLYFVVRDTKKTLMDLRAVLPK